MALYGAYATIVLRARSLDSLLSVSVRRAHAASYIAKYSYARLLDLKAEESLVIRHMNVFKSRAARMYKIHSSMYCTIALCLLV